jgi:hypothetical protein
VAERTGNEVSATCALRTLREGGKGKDFLFESAVTL